jgi:phosphatidate cytidylyltransferase
MTAVVQGNEAEAPDMNPSDSPQPELSRPSRMGVVMQRIGYGATAIAVLLGVFLADAGIAMRLAQSEGMLAALFRRGSVIPAVVLAFCCVGAAEMVAMLRARGARPFAGFAFAMIVTLVLSPWLSAAGWLGQQPAVLEGLYWPVISIGLSIFGVGCLAILRGDPEGSTRDIAVTVLLILYLGFLPSFALQLRSGRDTAGNDGAWLLLITLLVSKSSDIGAYFAGTAFGRRRLIPSISPGKSVEGFVGGIVAAAFVGWLFASAPAFASTRGAGLVGGPESEIPSGQIFLLFLHEITFRFSIPPHFSIFTPGTRGLFFGMVISIVSQIGDLLESCFKRDAGFKDSGQIIPHFGGVLDLMDSPILAVPAGWLLLTVVLDAI